MTKGLTARLFAALELPGEVTAELAAWARAALSHGAHPRAAAAADVRLLGGELMHVTLCFLGARPVEEIDALAGALLATEPEPLALALGAHVWLPPRRPRALAVEIADEGGGLHGLQAQLAGALAQVSTWEPERRRYRAHVTVARVRSQGSRRGEPAAAGERSRAAASVPGAEVLPATPALHFAPTAIALYRSWLSPSGASYEQLATAGFR